jgi:NAD+ synthase
MDRSVPAIVHGRFVSHLISSEVVDAMEGRRPGLPAATTIRPEGITVTSFSRDVLRMDVPRVADTLETSIRQAILEDLRRRGAVVGVSGGIDSAVVATLCARALGPDRVVALLMPDRDSSDESTRLGRTLAAHLGIRSIEEDITRTLEAFGCYERQAEAIRMVFPDYGEGWRCKLTLPSLLDSDRLNLTHLTVADPDGREQTARMTPAAYLQMVAATNFKQRTRTVLEYYHADRLGYAVAGTPNLLEHDQGFFVKQGDGAADLKPIAALYKSQVFELAAFLGVPDEIQARTPTTDTFSLPQTQEEFYFALPYREMDLCLWAHDHDVPAATAGTVLGLTGAQVERVYRDIEAKRRASHYLHRAALVLDPGTED